MYERDRQPAIRAAGPPVRAGFRPTGRGGLRRIPSPVVMSVQQWARSKQRRLGAFATGKAPQKILLLKRYRTFKVAAPRMPRWVIP
jgi:hypothetical protein